MDLFTAEVRLGRIDDRIPATNEGLGESQPNSFSNGIIVSV